MVQGEDDNMDQGESDDNDESIQPPAISTSIPLTSLQVKLVSEARDEYLKLEADEAAYESHIKWIESWQAALDILRASGKNESFGTETAAW